MAYCYCARLLYALPLPLIFLSGCMSSKPQQFATAFLPSAPAIRSLDLEPPPRIEPSLYSSSLPRDLPMLVDRARAESMVDKRIQAAEDRFQAGKRLYQEGDAERARREFDAAIETLMTVPEGLADRQKVERKLDQLVDNIYRYDLDRLASDTVVYQKAPIDEILEMTFPTDPQLKPKVGEEVQATLSQLPLEASDAVLSYIHYFSTDRGRRTLISGLRRGERYHAMINRILDEEGVPKELYYLAQAESGFIPYAVSCKRASGMWQFMQFRGREYGLNQTQWSDDRFDPEKSTRAAARHLRDLYTELGDWYLAMAAYNCGPLCVDRAVEKTGFADFWELSARNALPKQTRNYVPLILAMTIMAKNPRDYGIEDIEGDKPIEYDTVAVTAPTNLWLVSDIVDHPLAELRELNPALIKSLAPTGFQLRVPKGAAPQLTAALEQMPAERRASWRMHRVSDGETLAAIARRFKVPASLLASTNHVSVEAPSAGDLLLIPAASAASQTPARGSGARYAKSRRTSHGTHARTVSTGVIQHRAGKRRARIAGAVRNRG